MLKLKELRKNKTQNEIAKALGITQRTYSNYEAGNRQPDQDTLIKIADYFNVSVDYLLGRTETIDTAIIKRPDYELSEKFLQDYAELLKDKSFIDTTKLYNEITPELRAMVLGYIVGLLRSYNIDTKKILGY